MRKTDKKTIQILITLFLLTAILQGCATIRPDVDISSVSPADEANYGKMVDPFVLQHLGALSKNETAQAYLAEIGARLKTGHQQCTFSLVNDPAPAAFALPDGEIVVTSGLLYHLETENELLALLAHLVGHDLARHGLQLALTHHQLSEKSSVTYLPSVYDAAAVATSLLTAPFNEEQEIVADRHAAEIMTASGFDPTLLLKLMPALYARLGDLPDYQSGSMTRNHPFSSKRYSAQEVTVKTLSFSGSEANTINSDTFTEVRTTLLETRPAYETYQRALNLEKQGDIDQAITLYLQAAVAAPEETLLLTGLGMVYMRQGVLVAARQHLTRAARIDSNYYYSQLGLGYIYLQQNDLTKAAKRLRRSQALLPTSQGGYLLARVFDEAGNRAAAFTAYREIVHYFKGSQMGRLAEQRIIELESTRELE